MTGFLAALAKVAQGLAAPLGLIGQLATGIGAAGAPPPVDCAPEPVVLVGCGADVVSVAWSCPRAPDTGCAYDVEVSASVGIGRVYRDAARGVLVEARPGDAVRLARGSCRGPVAQVPAPVMVEKRGAARSPIVAGSGLALSSSPRERGPER